MYVVNGGFVSCRTDGAQLTARKDTRDTNSAWQHRLKVYFSEMLLLLRYLSLDQSDELTNIAVTGTLFASWAKKY